MLKRCLIASNKIIIDLIITLFALLTLKIML